MLPSLKKRIPEPIRDVMRSWKYKTQQRRLALLPPFSEDDFYRILTEELGIQKGRVVFFHSAAENLRPSFPQHHILTILREVVGEEGTILTSTYPRQLSSEFLKNDLVFDVRKTPSYTGVLSEFFRRTKGTIRSLHPTKSVCAMGPYAYELTDTHQNSPYPYDICSPYYKIMEHDGIIVNLGVSPLRVSLVHCVEDMLKDEFPVKVYLDNLFEAKCINYDGNIEIVKTYAHDPSKMRRNVQRYIDKYISKSIYQDITIYGRRFFIVNAKSLFEQMIDLARKNITVYSRKVYK